MILINIDKFQKIIFFYDNNREQIVRVLNQFYATASKEYGTVIPNFSKYGIELLKNKKYGFFEFPLKDNKIGALFYTNGDAQYIVLNTSRSIANNNFALAHEIYHVMNGNYKGMTVAELYVNGYSEDFNEMMANSFAGCVLMPETDFKSTYSAIIGSEEICIKDEFKLHFNTILRLMDYYATTYMSVLIRIYELNLIKEKKQHMLERLLTENDETSLIRHMEQLYLNTHILKPSRNNNLQRMMAYADILSRKNVQEGFYTEEERMDLTKLLLGSYHKIVQEEGVDHAR